MRCSCQLPLKERFDVGNAAFSTIRFEHTSFEPLELRVLQTVEINIIIREELARHLREQMGGVGVKEDHDHLHLFLSVEMNRLIIGTAYRCPGSKPCYPIHPKGLLAMKDPLDASGRHNDWRDPPVVGLDDAIVMHVGSQPRSGKEELGRYLSCHHALVLFYESQR